MVDFDNGRTRLSVTFHRNLVRGSVAKKEKKCQENMELLCVSEAIKKLLESHRIIPFNCMAGYANIIITRRSQFCSPENVCVVPAPKLEPPRI